MKSDDEILSHVPLGWSKLRADPKRKWYEAAVISSGIHWNAVNDWVTHATKTRTELCSIPTQCPFFFSS